MLSFIATRRRIGPALLLRTQVFMVAVSILKFMQSRSSFVLGNPRSAENADRAEIEGTRDQESSTEQLADVGALPLLKAVLSVAIVTGILLLVGRFWPFNLATVAYLIPVVVAATQWGRWPAVLAAACSAAAADFFFVTPYYSLRIDNPEAAVDLLLFLFVALVTSTLAARLREETAALRERDLDMHRLYALSRRLANCFTVQQIDSAIRAYLSEVFDISASSHVLTMIDREPATSEDTGVPTCVRTTADAMMSEATRFQTVVDQASRDVWVLRTVESETSRHWVIGINAGAIQDSRAAVQLESILDEAASTLQRLDLGKAREVARLQFQTQLLKDALHGTISHELRTPLTVVQGAAAVLESIPAIRSDPRIHGLVDSILEESDRLNSFVQNLLHVSRVSSSGISPQFEWTAPGDLVNVAISQRCRKLEDHVVDVSSAADLPLVLVDKALIAEAIGQILENAAKYSPAGSTISIRTRALPRGVTVSVSDRGFGVAPDDSAMIGQRSFRSPRHLASVPGTGLGFWIASTFVGANGGTIKVSSDGVGQGTTVSIVLPTDVDRTSFDSGPADV